MVMELEENLSMVKNLRTKTSSFVTPDLVSYPWRMLEKIVFNDLRSSHHFGSQWFSVFHHYRQD